jgi:hypothetical protein
LKYVKEKKTQLMRERKMTFCNSIVIRMIKSRKIRWAGHVARMEENGNAYGIFVGYPEGKRPLGKPRRSWMDEIKMNLRDIEWDGVDMVDLAQDRDQRRALVNTVMNLRVPRNFGKFLSSCETVGISRMAQPYEVS